MTQLPAEFSDCLFPTNNDLEVPTLRLDMQAERVDIPFVCYGEQARTFKMNGNGTLHFYTEDYRYADIFTYPSKIYQHDPRNIVEPNFSLFCETPIAFGLQSIYQKRWLARAMQDKGIRVFVDLNVNSKFYKLNMLGVPMGWRSFCTRGYSDRLQYLQVEYEIAKEVAGQEPLFVVYGGGRLCEQFAHEHSCVYVSPMIDLKNNYRRAKKKIENSIALNIPGMDINHIIENAEANLLNNQVKDYRDGSKNIES